jgi:hypothetical protein
MILMDFSYFFLLFSGFWAGFGVLFWEFLRFQLLFSWSFPAFWLGFGCCLGNFCGFSYFFLLFSGFLGGVWGAVLGISAISATFSALFRIFGWGLGCCLGNFCGFSYFFLLFSSFLAGFGVLFWRFLRFQLHKARLLCYQPMAIVHYDNLKIQYFLNKKTKKMSFQKKQK